MVWKPNLKFWEKKKQPKLVPLRSNVHEKCLRVSIVGWKIALTKALVLDSYSEYLSLEVDQPVGKVGIIGMTSRAENYKSGDLVKVFGLVMKQFPVITLGIESISFIGTDQEYLDKKNSFSYVGAA